MDKPFLNTCLILINEQITNQVTMNARWGTKIETSTIEWLLTLLKNKPNKFGMPN